MFEERYDKSSLSDGAYVLWMMIGSLVAASLVYFLNLRIVECHSARQSFCMAVAFTWVFGGIAYLRTSWDNRNMIHVLSGIFVGTGIYSMYIYWMTHSAFCKKFLLAALVIVVLCTIPYLATEKDKYVTLRHLRARIGDSLHLSRFVLAILGVIISISLPISYKMNSEEVRSIEMAKVRERFPKDRRYVDPFTGLVYQEDEYNVTRVYGDEYRLKMNLDRIQRFVDEESWGELTDETRQDAVIALVECEARYLGVPFELEVVFKEDMEYEMKGYYSHYEHKIFVNNQALQKDGGLDAMITVLHEMRHVYQQCMCDAFAKLSPQERNLIAFQGIEDWCRNFNEYADCNESYMLYYCQAVEEDARNSSYDSAQEYLKEIYELQGKE